MTSPADVARRAAVIVQARGHCKGDFGDTAGRVCLWGAIRAAMSTPSDALFFMGQHVAAKKLDQREWFDWPGASWNDDPATTVTDVAKLLLQVADDIDAGGAS